MAAASTSASAVSRAASASNGASAASEFVAVSALDLAVDVALSVLVAASPRQPLPARVLRHGGATTT